MRAIRFALFVNRCCQDLCVLYAGLALVLCICFLFFSLSRLFAVVFLLIVTVIIIIVVTIAKLMVIKKGILLLCIISRSWLESLFSCLFPLAFRKWLFCPLSFVFVASGSITSDAFKHDEYYWEVTDDFKTRGFQFDVPAALAWGTAGHRGAAPQAGLAEAVQAFCAK